jgi:predicted DNA-binding transcriptional regulator AlpA
MPEMTRAIIRSREVERRTGVDNSTIWRWEKKGQFPKRVLLNPSGTAVGWYEDEVNAFCAARVRAFGKFRGVIYGTKRSKPNPEPPVTPARRLRPRLYP